MVKGKKVSRRSFLKAIGGVSLLGVGASVAGCGTQAAGGKGWMPSQYNVPAKWPVQVKGRVPIDPTNAAIVRNDSACILCGQCLEVCRNMMGVYGYYELPVKKESICVHCGQCTMWCPTGAITERSHVEEVKALLADKDLHVVVQTAPATKVSLGEEFGLEAGSLVEKQQTAALKQLGFAGVFDTCFAADLTIMEESSELLARLKGGQELPQFTSCCPAWVKFVEYYYADLLPHLSSCKSPQQMLGSVIKEYYAAKQGVAGDKIKSIAVMPCTAKKFECQRQLTEKGTARSGQQDIDYILTTREAATLMKQSKIDMLALPDAEYDSPMGESSGGGRIFGATGGVAEAAVRNAYYLATGQEPPSTLLKWEPVRGMKGVKETTVEIPGAGTLRVAVCHGLYNSREILEAIRAKQGRWDFLEFMACPGGCIGGGGQPRTSLPPNDGTRKARIASLYKLDDQSAPKRCSYQNEQIQELYKNWLGQPLSEKAEHELHTHFTDRSRLLTPKPVDATGQVRGTKI